MGDSLTINLTPLQIKVIEGWQAESARDGLQCVVSLPENPDGGTCTVEVGNNSPMGVPGHFYDLDVDGTARPLGGT